jgi:hypothetical protein
LIEDARRDPEELLADGIALSVAAQALIEVALKRAAGRERDIADLSDLEAAHGDLPTAGS